MKIKVSLNQDFRVSDIEQNDNELSWIENYQNKHGGSLPHLPGYLFPIVNYYTPGQPIGKSIEVIPISGQQWQEMNNQERGRLLELVEFTGQDVNDYIRHFQSMYPKTPDFKNRK